MQLGRYDQAHSAFEQVLNATPQPHRDDQPRGAGVPRTASARRRCALLRHALVLAPGDQTATTELALARKGRLDPKQVAQDLVNNAAARVH